MANIQKYIGEIISGKTAFKGVDFKKSILADFLKSGIMLFDNDSCAPFVQGAPLVELLTDRIYEGEHGQVAYEKVERAVSYYDQAKKKDSKLSYAFNYQFEDVGDITMTYEFFEKALKECGELSRENVFGVRAKDKSTAKSTIFSPSFNMDTTSQSPGAISTGNAKVPAVILAFLICFFKAFCW